MQQQLKSFKRHLRLAFVVPLLLAVVLGSVFALQTYYLRDSMQAVEHSYQVQTRSRTILKLLLDMETSLRGYLLTGEEHFLQPYRESAPQVQPALEELSRLTAEDPQQQQLVRDIEDGYGQWHQFSSRMIEMRQNGGPVNNVALNLGGKRIMDELRASRDQLLQIEEHRLQLRIDSVRRALVGLLATAVALSLVFGLIIATFSRRELATVAGTYDAALKTAYNRTEELHQNQRWLSAVLGSIADGVIATDLNGSMVFSNVVAREILALPEDEIARARTRDAIRVVDEYSRAAIADPFEQVMATQKPVFTEGHLLLLRKDGSEVPVSLQASSIRGDDGKVSGAVIVLRDVTDQRQSERTLQSAEKLAGIGRIAATVAHEIHNPLDALGNLLYLVEHSDSLTDPNKTYVRLAREELDRVTSISEQMLTFSRETRQPVKVNLSEVFDNVLTLYAARIRRMDVVVVKSFSDNGSVVAFPGEMRQVFSNLIGNALDAMNGPGRLTLRIEQRHSWQGADEIGVRVLICDTGSGVPPEVRHKLMEPFITSKGEKGTGLGLWVCRGIVEKYRGRLRYRTSTTPGRSGTCFSVFFPTAHNEAQQRTLTGQRAS
jgi:PAS domain S-box-containing protein